LETAGHSEAGRSPGPPAARSRNRALIVAVAIALTALALAWSLTLPPREAILDDGEVALRHPAVATGRGIATTPFYGLFHRPLWRPWTTLTYRLDWAARDGVSGAPDASAGPDARPEPGGQQALRGCMGRVNALWALCSVALAFLFLQRVGAGAAVAAALAAILLLHPVNAESTLALAGRADTLAACALLGALIVYARWLRPAAPAAPDRPRRLRPAAAWTAFAGLFSLGLLAKETALLLPVFLLGYEWTLAPRPRGGAPEPGDTSTGNRRSSFLPAVGLTVAIAAIWLLVRSAAMNSWPEAFTRDPAFDFVQSLGSGKRLRLALYLPAHYLGLLLLLVPVVPGYGYLLARPESAPPVTLGNPGTFAVAAPGAAELLLGSAVLAAGAALFLLLRRRAPLAAFGLWMMLTSLAVVLPLFAPNGQVASTRNLFFPLLGLLLALTAGGRALAARRNRAGRRRALTVVLALLLALAAGGLGLRTRALARQWGDQGSLLAAFASAAPRAPEVPLARATDAVAAGDLDRAARHLEEAIGLFPRAPRALLTLGLIRAQQGNQSLAARVLSDAALVADRIVPHSSVASRAHLGLGTLLATQKLDAPALEEFRKAVRADSTNVEALARVGLLEALSYSTARDGIRHLRRALELDDGRLGPAAGRLKTILDRAVRNLALAEEGHGSYDTAMGAADSVLAAPPGGTGE